MTHRTAKQLARIAKHVRKHNPRGTVQDLLKEACEEATKQIGRPVTKADFYEASDTLAKKRRQSAQEGWNV